MTPEERDLIGGVFERMRSVGFLEKDREAETFINQSVRQIPDSAYMLVQSVLVQEQTLQQADQRIRDLEDQVAGLEAALRDTQSKSGPSAGGGFLGGLFGGGSKPSAPPMARQSAGFGGSVPASSPWGRQAAPAPQYQQPPMQGQAPQQASGGGFMKTAMMTAAGVAGGMLVANSINNMMNGKNSSGTESVGNDRLGMEPQYQDASNNDQGGSYESNPYQDASSNDQGTGGDVQDAGYQDDSGGGGWGGGDVET